MPRCRECKDKFEPKYFLQKFCMKKDGCIKAHVIIANQPKEKKRQQIAEKKALMTKPEWLQLLQKVFNTYIRTRDKNQPCISCGTQKSINYDAGHFYSAGNYSFLRFDENNVHKQCSFKCNKNLHGNLLEYRKRLILRIGAEAVDVLDNQSHKKLELTIPEIQEQIKIYRAKIKSLN